MLHGSESFTRLAPAFCEEFKTCLNGATGAAHGEGQGQEIAQPRQGEWQ
jgi:hypothetical protein